MATSRWTEALLDEASRQGDNPSDHPNADELASGVMSHEGGVHRYNHLLEVADALLEAPSLALTRDSALRLHLEEFSPEALRYFEPAEAPPWVDEARLRAASALWEDNSVAAIAVLYALSLPCTYLYKNGVPALYETGKLTEAEYIFQRIHETGVFVDDVMSLGGIAVLKDYEPEEEQIYLETLRGLDPEGDWKRAPRGHFVRGAGECEDARALGARVEREVATRRKTRRFLWGRGFLTARKVRFLHSSIRFMLRHPEKMRPDAAAGGDPRTLTDRLSNVPAPWNEAYGAPINQEELAFGLLSFGYLIPMGLERWGCPVSRAQKEAFLHLWRVIGHVMGIRGDLMTDDWDEATDLLALVMKRQAGHSPFGEHLTVALMAFARTYFPHLSTGLKRRLPAHLILDQLGRMNPDYPAMVLPADVLQDTTRLAPRAAFNLLMLWVRFYYRVQHGLLSRIPLAGETMLSALHRASEELIASWRDQFRRQPFDLSGNLAWIRPRGADKESEARLQRWRLKMFNNLGFAIACLFAMVALLVGAGVAAVVPSSQLAAKWTIAKGLCTGSILSAFTAWAWMTWRMPKVFDSRPR